MLIEVKVPQQGLTTETVKIVRWLKKPGDAVSEGEPLAEFESEKAELEIESPAGGTLVQILVEEGAEANVGAPVALIDQK